MSTRSVVGTIDEQGNFQGRYVHWDGSPHTRVRVLAEALAMYDGGLDQLITALLASEWSSLSPADGVLGEPYDEEPYLYQGTVGQAGDVEEWGFFFTSREPTDAELIIVQGDEVPTEVGRIKVIDLATITDAQIFVIECGEHYERCKHYAWLHFPELEGSRLSTRAYLGHQPLQPRDAVEAVYKGRKYTLTGSGYAGGYYSGGRKGLWYGTGRDTETGEEINIPLYRTNSRSGQDKPISTTTLIYPSIAEELAR